MSSISDEPRDIEFPSTLSSSPLQISDCVCVSVPLPRFYTFYGIVVACRRHVDSSKNNNTNNQNFSETGHCLDYVFVKATLPKFFSDNKNLELGHDMWVPRSWCIKIGAITPQTAAAMLELKKKGNTLIATDPMSYFEQWFKKQQQQLSIIGNKDETKNNDNDGNIKDNNNNNNNNEEVQDPDDDSIPPESTSASSTTAPAAATATAATSKTAKKRKNTSSSRSTTSTRQRASQGQAGEPELRMASSAAEYPVSILYLGFELGNPIPTAWPAVLQGPPPPPPSANLVYSVHVCHRCLAPFAKKTQLMSHFNTCNQSSLPASAVEVFASPSGNTAVFRLDGAVEPEFCLRMAILGRSFIASKDLWDTDVHELEFFALYCTAERLGLNESASKRHLSEFNDVLNQNATAGGNNINFNNKNNINNIPYHQLQQNFLHRPNFETVGEFDSLSRWSLRASTWGTKITSLLDNNNNNNKSISTTNPDDLASLSTTGNNKNPSLFFAGFFSRVKRTPNHTLCCILILPCFQNRALGSLLVRLAYGLDQIRLTDCGCAECCAGRTGLAGAVTSPWSSGGVKLLCSFMREKLVMGARRLLQEEQEKKQRDERRRMKNEQMEEKTKQLRQMLPTSNFSTLMSDSNDFEPEINIPQQNSMGKNENCNNNNNNNSRGKPSLSVSSSSSSSSCASENSRGLSSASISSSFTNFSFLGDNSQNQQQPVSTSLFSEFFGTSSSGHKKKQHSSKSSKKEKSNQHDDENQDDAAANTVRSTTDATLIFELNQSDSLVLPKKCPLRSKEKRQQQLAQLQEAAEMYRQRFNTTTGGRDYTGHGGFDANRDVSEQVVSVLFDGRSVFPARRRVRVENDKNGNDDSEEQGEVREIIHVKVAVPKLTSNNDECDGGMNVLLDAAATEKKTKKVVENPVKFKKRGKRAAAAAAAAASTSSSATDDDDGQDEDEKEEFVNKTFVLQSMQSKLLSCGCQESPLRFYCAGPTKQAMTWSEAMKKLVPSLNPQDAFSMMVADGIIGQIPVVERIETTKKYVEYENKNQVNGDDDGKDSGDDDDDDDANKKHKHTKLTSDSRKYSVIFEQPSKIGLILIPKEFWEQQENVNEQLREYRSAERDKIFKLNSLNSYYYYKKRNSKIGAATTRRRSSSRGSGESRTGNHDILEQFVLEEVCALTDGTTASSIIPQSNLSNNTNNNHNHSLGNYTINLFH